MKIYISGKVTGEDYLLTVQKFKIYENCLKRKGYDVVNPMNHIEKDTEWNEAMRKALIVMLDCDAIFLLDDWSESKGAKIEFKIAFDLNYKIFRTADMRIMEIQMQS